jgi:hypothetical protein
MSAQQARVATKISLRVVATTGAVLAALLLILWGLVWLAVVAPELFHHELMRLFFWFGGVLALTAIPAALYLLFFAVWLFAARRAGRRTIGSLLWPELQPNSAVNADAAP